MHYSRYNKEDVLEDKIKGIVEELKSICYKEKIPMFLSLCYKNTDEKSFYYNEMVGSRSNSVFLADDKFKDHVNVMNDFVTIPKRNDLIIEEDIYNQLFSDEDIE